MRSNWIAAKCGPLARQELRVLALHEVQQLLAHMAAQVPALWRVGRCHQAAQLHSVVACFGDLQQAEAPVPVLGRLTGALQGVAQRLQRHAVVEPEKDGADQLRR